MKPGVLRTLQRALKYTIALSIAGLLQAGCATVTTTAEARLPSATIAYALLGDSGPSVVLQAGLGDGKSVWSRIAGDLSRDHRVLAFDRPGYGDSPARTNTRDPCTIAAEQQETITRDSVTVKLNAVLWYRVTDAAKSVIAVADAPAAVYQLALTSLRNSIGQHDLDEVLQERDKINALLRENIADSTKAWGLEVERFEMKDVELPEAMQEVMAMQAQAIREKRARIIKAEAELEASQKLSEAALQMASNPVAVELRRMQMIAEVGAENNTTTVLMIPSDFVTLAKSFDSYLREHTTGGALPKN